jgi:acyl dehydratase
MPIDLKQALGYALSAVEASWKKDDVILYHLGLGAGDPPTDKNELEYTYEGNLKVLPSFGVIPVFTAIMAIGSVPGKSPPAAKLSSVSRVANILDKGKAAFVELEVESKDEKGEKLFTNLFTLFLRGEGGFGGERGPDKVYEAPTRAPDHVVEKKTSPNQALLYRLSGDKNPLHADPGFAKMGGFDKPILHGLCSFGIACKSVVDAVCEGKVDRVARYSARFAGVVFPGETLLTSMWKEGDTVFLSATTKERGTPVLSHASITLK